MLSSSSEGITFSELNLTGEELKYLDEVEENQEHNIGNILAVPNLSESPRPPATPSISLDETGEKKKRFKLLDNGSLHCWIMNTMPIKFRILITYEINLQELMIRIWHWQQCPQ
ncbi:hypothetical protein J6590_094263 [Homalodisca vitripennis]|nr:hypothetical protein J6590_094263 [Homalodisca vitripennis]